MKITIQEAASIAVNPIGRAGAPVVTIEQRPHPCEQLDDVIVVTIDWEADPSERISIPLTEWAEALAVALKTT